MSPDAAMLPANVEVPVVSDVISPVMVRAPSMVEDAVEISPARVESPASNVLAPMSIAPKPEVMEPPLSADTVTKEAIVVMYGFDVDAMYSASVNISGPSIPSMVPVQLPVASRVIASPVQSMPVPSTSEQSNDMSFVARVTPVPPVAVTCWSSTPSDEDAMSVHDVPS